MSRLAKPILFLVALAAIALVVYLSVPAAAPVSPPSPGPASVVAPPTPTPTPAPTAPLGNTVLSADDFSMVVHDTENQPQTLSAGEFSFTGGIPASADDQITVIDYIDFSPDYNSSGAVDAADVLSFISAWTSGTGFTDFNMDGARTPADLIAFLNIWFNPASAPPPIVHGLD